LILELFRQCSIFLFFVSFLWVNRTLLDICNWHMCTDELLSCNITRNTNRNQKNVLTIIIICAYCLGNNIFCPTHHVWYLNENSKIKYQSRRKMQNRNPSIQIHDCLLSCLGGSVKLVWLFLRVSLTFIYGPNVKLKENEKLCI
jgi:hypothetical protein